MFQSQIIAISPVRIHSGYAPRTAIDKVRFRSIPGPTNNNLNLRRIIIGGLMYTQIGYQRSNETASGNSIALTPLTYQHVNIVTVMAVQEATHNELDPPSVANDRYVLIPSKTILRFRVEFATSSLLAAAAMKFPFCVIVYAA